MSYDGFMNQIHIEVISGDRICPYFYATSTNKGRYTLHPRRIRHSSSFTTNRKSSLSALVYRWNWTTSTKIRLADFVVTLTASSSTTSSSKMVGFTRSLWILQNVYTLFDTEDSNLYTPNTYITYKAKTVYSPFTINLFWHFLTTTLLNVKLCVYDIL